MAACEVETALPRSSSKSWRRSNRCIAALIARALLSYGARCCPRLILVRWWWEVQKLSCIADFFPQALRHTMETKLAELKVPPHIRDQPLDHARHAVPIGLRSLGVS